MCKIKAILVDEKRHIRFGDWTANDVELLNEPVKTKMVTPYFTTKKKGSVSYFQEE